MYTYTNVQDYKQQVGGFKLCVFFNHMCPVVVVMIPFFRTIFSVGNHQLVALHPSAGNDCQ